MKRKNTPDAVDLLDADHLAVHAMFEQYRELVRSGAAALARRTLAEDLCLALTIHAKLEQELFYPAVRDALQDEDLVDESEDQHGSMRDLVGQILTGKPEDELYDAKVAVLCEYVERHVRQEREQVFNRLLASGIDLQSLGRRIARRREELRSVADALREDALAQATA